MARFKLIRGAVNLFRSMKEGATPILDGLFGPERITVSPSGDEELTKGFFRSRTNVSLFVTVVFSTLHIFDINFGLEEEELINAIYFTGELLSVLLAGWFKKISKVPTRVVTRNIK